jgi:hypothetical protein
MAVLKTPSILAEKGICHITRDTITALPDHNGFSADPLTDLIRSRARQLRALRGVAFFRLHPTDLG